MEIMSVTIKLTISLIVVIFFCYFNEVQSETRRLYPIILVPGYMGTKLEVRLDGAHDAPVFCLRRTGTWVLWFSLKEFIPMMKLCWLYSAKLNYDPSTRKTLNSKGVTVIVPSFGGLKSVEYLSPWLEGMISQTTYFGTMVQLFEESGLKRDLHIRGAPYDWRRSMNEMDSWFDQFGRLIEDTYNRNNGTKVVLLGHSMGGNVIYVFLRRQSQQWKNKYIRLMWTLATPFGGNFKYMYDYLFDDDYPASLSTVIRKAERTYPSLAFLIPKPEAWGCETFITSPNLNYSSCNYEQFFNNIGQPQAYQMWKDVGAVQGSFEHPGVPIKCWGGGGQRTLRKMTTSSNNLYSLAHRTVIKESDGDGFVNYNSLRVCLKWSENSKYPFEFKTLNKSHMDMIKSRDVIDLVIKSYYELD